MKQFRQWMNDRAYERERFYVLAALLFMAGVAFLSQSLSGGVSKNDPVNRRFAIVLAAAGLHAEITGSFPTAAKLRFLLQHDGLQAKISSCEWLPSSPSHSPLVWVDPASTSARLYAHSYDQSGTLVTLVASPDGRSQVISSCGVPYSTAPSIRRH